MSTQFNRGDTPLALRFWGGNRRGAVLEMLVTKREFARLEDGPVFADNTNAPAGTDLRSFVAGFENSSNITVEWQSPATLRAKARSMRNHRHADLLKDMALELDVRAKRELLETARLV